MHQRMASSRSLLTHVKVSVTLLLQERCCCIRYKQKGCHMVLQGEMKMSYTVKEREEIPACVHGQGQSVLASPCACRRGPRLEAPLLCSHYERPPL